MMPLIGHLFLPIVAFVQIFFIRSYLEEYSNQFYNESSAVRQNIFEDMTIVIKWTLLKWLLFIIFQPIYHIPLFGLVLSIVVSTCWLLLIYSEIVSRSIGQHDKRRSFLKEYGVRIFWMSMLGLFVFYMFFGFVGFVAVAMPPARIPLTVTLIAVLMCGGLTWGSSIFDSFRAYCEGEARPKFNT